MIQRIQTLYLILTALLPGIFLKGSFLKFINKSGEAYSLGFFGVEKTFAGAGEETMNETLPLSVVLGLISLLSIVCIFLYRNRKLQLKFSLSVILLALLLIAAVAWYGYLIVTEYQAYIQPGINMIFPLLILFFAVMAHRSIKKDENLVRSYDRLR